MCNGKLAVRYCCGRKVKLHSLLEDVSEENNTHFLVTMKKCIYLTSLPQFILNFK